MYRYLCTTVGTYHLHTEVLYLIKGVADVAEIFPNHLFAQAFPRDKKSGHSGRRVVKESLQ